MLVLTRKAGEDIRIGDDIVISVFQTHSGRVKLGIEAPRFVTVRRQELNMEPRPGIRSKSTPPR